MRIGLIGPTQSGKTTLFSAITGQAPDPAHMAQENLATVTVPEPRLDLLVQLYKPKKRVEAHIEFVDIPGFSLETPHQQEEFRKHFPSLRLCDCLVAVVRDFASDRVATYRNRVDAAADLEELRTELIFADLEAVANRIQRLNKSLSRPSKTSAEEKAELAFMQRLQEALEAEKPVSSVVESAEEHKWVSSFQFLTEKPLVVVINVDEGRAAAAPDFQAKDAHSTIALCAEIEAEIAQLEGDDRKAFLEDLGVAEAAHDRLIHLCYEAAGMICFLTYAGDECRAWTVRKGADALEAAGKIHTDIARGFIRAEVVAYDDLGEAGDHKAAKAAGKVRLEGKSYVVADGDVIQFRFNV
ncbi:MAG: redox-regulated ATPase YchF [Phycisphaerales bacterium]|nr:MAG: redox-regulated ATPase YchF [Phycisphaerales bacterium]